MKSFKILILSISLLLFSKSNAQAAFDGLYDNSILVGYANVGGKSGIDLQFDGALNEYFSIGGKFSYIFKQKENVSEFNFEEYEKVSNFFESFNTGIYLRLHNGVFFDQMTERLDPFVGVDLTLKNIAAHAGLKYQFTETIGVYFLYAYSFSSSIDGLFDTKNKNERINYFAKPSTFSFGMTITL